MTEYNLEYIEKLRIHELRDFARKVGVSSPTTLKKDELISKISYIIRENDKDDDNTNKYINTQNNISFYKLLTSDNSNILTSLISKSEQKNGLGTIVVSKQMGNNVSYDTEEMIGINLVVKQNDANYDCEELTMEGYLNITEEGYGVILKDGFLPSSEDVYITKALIKKHGLKTGCLIKGKVRQIIENNPQLMYEILTIDGCSRIKKNDFAQLPYNMLTDKFKNTPCEICKGGRVYFSSMSLVDAIKFSKDLSNDNDINVKFVNIKAKPEERFVDSHNLDVINIPFNKTAVDCVSIIEMVVERIKRELENSKSNVLVLYNFAEIIRAFNVAEEGFYVFDKFNAKAINRLTDIMYLSKFVDNKQHSTIIFVDKNGIPDDTKTIMNLEFLPLFNSIN